MPQLFSKAGCQATLSTAAGRRREDITMTCTLYNDQTRRPDSKRTDFDRFNMHLESVEDGIGCLFRRPVFAGMTKLAINQSYMQYFTRACHLSTCM